MDKHHVTYYPEKIILIDSKEHQRKHYEQTRFLADELKIPFREAQLRLRLERMGGHPTIQRIKDF